MGTMSINSCFEHRVWTRKTSLVARSHSTQSSRSIEGDDSGALAIQPPCIRHTSAIHSGGHVTHCEPRRWCEALPWHLLLCSVALFGGGDAEEGRFTTDVAVLDTLTWQWSDASLQVRFLSSFTHHAATQYLHRSPSEILLVHKIDFCCRISSGSVT